MPMTDSTRHHDLLKAFGQPACPVCQMVLRDNQRDLFNLYQDRINKVETHQAFRAARGLCNIHAWQMAKEKGGAVSVAVMYESTLLGLMKTVEASAPGGRLGRLLPGGRGNGPGAPIADALQPSGPCLLCDSMNRAEAAYVQIIVDNINEADLRAAFEQSLGGLCLPHVQLMLPRLRSADDARWLTALHTAKWRSLQDELNLYLDQVRRNVPRTRMGPEGDSWLRAVRYLAGDDGVFGYRR